MTIAPCCCYTEDDCNSLLLLLLCLGAQNLQDRQTLKLGGQRSVPLPTGFLVGIAMVIGVISGGSATAVLLPDQRDRFD